MRRQEPPAPPSATLLRGALKSSSVSPPSPGRVSLFWAVVRPARGPASPGALSCLEGAGAAPCVPVLVPDLLLHLCIRQGLQQRAPLVSVACVPDGNLHRGQGVLTVEDERGRRLTEQLQERPLESSVHPAAGRQDMEPGFCTRLPTQGGRARCQHGISGSACGEGSTGQCCRSSHSQWTCWVSVPAQWISTQLTGFSPKPASTPPPHHHPGLSQALPAYCAPPHTPNFCHSSRFHWSLNSPVTAFWIPASFLTLASSF